MVKQNQNRGDVCGRLSDALRWEWLVGQDVWAYDVQVYCPNGCYDVGSQAWCCTCHRLLRTERTRDFVDWHDPKILWPRWEMWVSRWVKGAHSPEMRAQRTAAVRGVLQDAASAGWDDDGMTFTWAVALAWDALLVKMAEEAAPR